MNSDSRLDSQSDSQSDMQLEIQDIQSDAQEEQFLQVDTLVRNIGQLVTMASSPIKGASGRLQVLDSAAIAVQHGKIAWLGQDSDVPALFLRQHSNAINAFSSSNSSNSIRIIDAQGAVVTPGFVDSHTHLVFAGDRAEEFHLRRSGVSYGALLAQGRGILTTMAATRSADSATLERSARSHLATMLKYGTTTVEAKTGYGLDVETEERCLRIINHLNTQNDAASRVRVVPTFLGAHSVPPEYRDRRKAYVDLVVEEMLPRFSSLAHFCDVFCEREAFTEQESRRVLTRAKELGYALKVHADQLSPSGGSRLAAELGATSADHLDHATDEDLDALREAGVVATLLPGCSYTLRAPYPSARRYLERGLLVALATDFNPGTSYCENMQMMLGLAMSSMNMSLEEALLATTLHGAYALGLQDTLGSVEIGKRCELVLWSIPHYQEIGYHFGENLVHSVLVVA